MVKVAKYTPLCIPYVRKHHGPASWVEEMFPTFYTLCLIPRILEGEDAVERLVPSPHLICCSQPVAWQRVQWSTSNIRRRHHLSPHTHTHYLTSLKCLHRTELATHLVHNLYCTTDPHICPHEMLYTSGHVTT